MKRLMLTIALVLALPAVGWGANYYVDATSGSDSNTGLSNAQAWQTISKVNGWSFSAGDDVYFKCGETWTFSSGTKLTVDWSGVSVSNPSIVGAYYMAGSTEVHGVSGNKPVFDGNYVAPSTPPTSSYFGIIQVKSVSYITVQDIEIQETGFYGVGFDTATNVNAYRVKVDGAHSAGIRFKLVTTGKAYDNEITDAARSALTGGWPATLVSITSSDIDIQRNIVHEVYGEGIGIYTSSHDCLVKDNIVYAAAKVGIYIDHSWNNTVYRNIVYGTTDTTFHRSAWGPGQGISIADESWAAPQSRNNKIYSNLVAYSYWGISITSGTATWTMTDTDVYNNTIVDCDTNFYVSGFTTGGYSNSNIKNNISYCLTGDCDHASTFPSSHSGLTVDYNLWSSAPPASVDGANDPANAAPGLNKTSGWRTMTGGDALGSWWALSSAVSPAVDVGTLIGGYQLIDPDSVWVSNVSGADNTTGLGAEIGAFVWSDTASDDTDGDGIHNTTETQAGTNPNLATDNDTEAEKVATIVAASDAVADGYPTITDLTNTGLTGLIPGNLSAYETAIQAGADGDPTLAELQAIIDAVNTAQTNDTSNDSDCLAHYPLDTNNTDDKGGTALTFNNSAAISGGWLDMENYPSDQNQGAILAAENLPATTWWLSGQSGIGGACVMFQPETLPATAKYVIVGPLEWNNTKNVWAISLRPDGLLDIEIGYDSGAASERVITGTPVVAGNTYGVCMFYNATADDLWVYVRNSDGTILGSDIYDSDFLPDGATFNQEDSDLTFGYSGDNWGSFDGKIKEFAIWNGIDGSTFIAQYASDWVQGVYDRDTTETADCPTCTFWWRCESETLSETLDRYGATNNGDNTASPGSAVALAEASANIGSYGIQASTTYDVYTFVPTNMISSAEGRLGLYLNVRTWNAGAEFILLQNGSTDNFKVRLAGSDELDSTWRDNNTARSSLTTSDANLSAGTWYWVEFAWKTSTDYREIFVNNVSRSSSSSTINTFNATENVWLIGQNYSSAATDIDIDNIIVSSDSTVSLYPFRDETAWPTSSPAGPEPATFGAPGLITTPDGTCTYAANTTATWTDTTVRYFGIPISAALTVTGLEGWPTLPLYAGPSATDVTYANYYGQCVDGGSQRYMVFKYTPNAGDRTADLLAVSTAIDCDKDDNSVNDASAIDSNNFDLCSAEYNAISSADVSGTGTITIEFPKPIGNPFTICDSGCDYVSWTAFDTATDAVAGDYFKYTSTNAETFVLPASCAVMSSIFQSDQTLQVAAASASVLNTVVKGTLDLDIAATLTNVAVPGTTTLANGVTITPSYSAFAQAEATIEAAGGTVTPTACQFGVADMGFVDEDGADFRLRGSSALRDAGTTVSGIVVDTRGVLIPMGIAPDIGAYEYFPPVVLMMGP